MKKLHRYHMMPFVGLPHSPSHRLAARRSRKPIRARLRGLATLVLGLAFLSGCSKTPVPTDPLKTGCSVSATEFDTWFETGAVSLNGVAKPADSVNFPDIPNCSFYKWAEQMFLWVNSPAPPAYGGGPRIFNSSAFYTVSPLDNAGDRTLIAHPSGNSTAGSLSLRSAQRGQHGLPVIMDKSGAMLEIEPTQIGPTGKQLILNEKGVPVEIERITMRDDGKPIFFDKTGDTIKDAKPLIRRNLRNLNDPLIVQKFLADKVPFFLNLGGNVVDVDQPEADGNILMAQNGSLVYYQIFVNDVYAYFLTAAKNNASSSSSFKDRFPTKPWQLAFIKNFAITHGKPSPDPFPDAEALAVEVKTAWVEAAGLANLSHYVTMNATIPTYQKVSSNLWVPNGQKIALMALVGMHVVGSAAGHPEMLWATFEHENNAPNAAYKYNSSGSGVKTVNPDFSGAYLFCSANPNVSQLNKPHLRQDPDPLNPHNIINVPSFPISPSNTIRGNAWGGATGVAPNPIDATVAASNSELISVNNDVRGMLDSNDVRNKYFLTGVTWTAGGGFNMPPENFGNPGNSGPPIGKAVGTSQMANMTMETYQQGFPASFKQFSNNCFSCHATDTTSVSHIFYTPGLEPSGLKPLF
jgi:hypothetical protein